MTTDERENLSMSTITILFGTESGNSEMVADELRDLLVESGFQAVVAGMGDVDVESLADKSLVVLISSTYGEGDLPVTAVDFHSRLQSERPDLGEVRFAAFGLGDSTYDTYNLGIATLVRRFEELGARRVGEIGHHDADSGLDPCAAAGDWLTDLLDHRALELSHC